MTKKYSDTTISIRFIGIKKSKSLEEFCRTLFNGLLFRTSYPIVVIDEKYMAIAYIKTSDKEKNEIKISYNMYENWVKIVKEMKEKDKKGFFFADLSGKNNDFYNFLEECAIVKDELRIESHIYDFFVFNGKIH